MWITIYVYLPLMYLCYVYYFVVNIFGLVDYNSWSQEYTNEMYLYGFYNFTNPEYELLICMSSVVALAWYCRLNKLE